MSHGNDKGGSYGPSIPLTRLFERVAKNGNHYLTGRLGAAKIVILKSSETTDDGVPIWNVLLQEGPQRDTTARADSQRDYQRPARSTAASRPEPERSAAPDFDDTIPF